MLSVQHPPYQIRQAGPSEVSLIGWLRLSSLVSLEMPGHALEEVRAVLSSFPDADPALVASGRYWVADCDGDLIGGAGWSVLPLAFRLDGLVDAGGRPARLSLQQSSVLVRGFFLDPDLGRSGVGAGLLAEIEADAMAAGFSGAEVVASASSQLLYRSLGFKPYRRLALVRAGGEELPIVLMRKPLPLPLAAAA